MTVGRLRELLANYPDDAVVVSDMHSQFSDISEIESFEAFENGGYWSKVYNPTDRAKAKRVVYIGATDSEFIGPIDHD
jgi:hypothetical protein